LSFGVSAIFLTRMRGRFSEDRDASHARPPFLESLRETFRFARAKPRVLGLLTVKAGYGLGAGVVAMVGVFGREVFHAGAWGIGLLFAARGIGALLGPFLLRASIREGDTQYRAIAWCVIGFGIGYTGLALSTTFALGFLAVLFAHLGGGAAWQISTYGLQRETPDAIRGRIFSADYGLVTLTMAISGLSSGIASDHFGPTAATMGIASVCLLFGIGWAIATWKLWSANPAHS
jgi:MFS family permease